MTLEAAELAILSRMLEEALDLSPAEFEVWLAALPEEERHLLPRLRDMLASRSARGNTSFLAAGPKFDADAIDETVAHVDDLIGPYRLIREIGHGGMGTVWLAERADGTLKRQIALKLPRLAWGAGLAERMARERDIGALLEHPNIARLYDAGVDGQGRPYLALEYIDGVAIDAWCNDRGLDVRARLMLFLQVIKAVAYAHGRLVVHRDLKPSNVLVTGDGQAHLLDFGIAKLLLDASADGQDLTQQADRLLTPQYASPEQIRGEAITVASDAYSLGALLYELLTRQVPYATTRRTIGAIEQAILEDEPPLASSRVEAKADAKALRGELDAIIAKALKREPGKRYATADAMAEDIVRHLEGERVLAQPDSLAYRMAKVMRKHRAAFTAAGLATVAVIGGAGVSLVQAKRANNAAERARVVKEFVVDVFKVNERGTQGNSELRQLPAELLLERGAKLIETKFSREPQLQAELYGVVGRIFSDLGANDLASDNAKHQIEALAAANAEPAEQARAFILLATSLLAEERLDEAAIRARRALELSGADPALRGEALITLAEVLFARAQFDEASKALDQFVGVRTGSGVNISGARAMRLRAEVLTSANRFNDALPLYKQAIDQALAAEGVASRLAIEIRLSLASILISLGRDDEAKLLYEPALATMRTVGGSDDFVAALRESGIFGERFRMGELSFADARLTLERDRQYLEDHRPSLPASIKAPVDFELGTAYLFWGDIAKADALITRAIADLQMPDRSPWMRLYFAKRQREVAMLVGRHEEAEQLSLEVIALRMQVGQGENPLASSDYMVAAQNLGMQGRFDDAERMLRSAPLFDARQGERDNPFSYRDQITRALGRIKLDRGDVRAAMELLPAKATDDLDGRVGDDELILRGETLCAAGRRAEGLALLERSLEWYRSRNFEFDPALARARAVTGLCALEDGRHQRAIELGALARAAFVAQPGVSPYFKRPSERLDRALATSAASNGTDSHRKAPRDCRDVGSSHIQSCGPA